MDDRRGAAAQRPAAMPAMFDCGCSHLKVQLGRCDIYDKHGHPREVSAAELPHTVQIHVEATAQRAPLSFPGSRCARATFQAGIDALAGETPTWGVRLHAMPLPGLTILLGTRALSIGWFFDEPEGSL